MRLLIPATEPNQYLCEAVLSALALGYPVPTLINWKQSFENSEWHANGTHIAKITGILNYLEGIGPAKEDELVVIIDGYDTWFQLKQDVLVSRYKEINRAAMNRIMERIGRNTVAAEGISQSILFSAQKNCGPLKSQLDEVACYGQPESPLRADLYGSDTDTLDRETNLPLHMRPHFLCSGFIAGPVKPLRNMFKRAEQKIRSSNHMGSDQHIYNEIFGEQQYQREVMRLRHQPLAEKFVAAFSKILGNHSPSIVDPHPSHKPMEHLEGHPLEFGIGLDYGLELVQSMVLSEFDGRLLVYSSNESLRQQQVDAGVDNAVVATLPHDISMSSPPFGALRDSEELPALSPGKSWAEIPLYTNTWTRSTPVSLHMNGFKEMRESMWDQLWFHEHAKSLLQRSRLDEDLGARDGLNGKLIQWDEMCKNFEADIF